MNAKPELDRLRECIRDAVTALQKHFLNLKTELFFAFGIPAIASVVIGFLFRPNLQNGFGFYIQMTAGAQLIISIFSAYWIFRFIDKLYALETTGHYSGYNAIESKNKLISFVSTCIALFVIAVVGFSVGAIPALAVVVFLPLCPFVSMFQSKNIVDDIKAGFELTTGHRIHLSLVFILFAICSGVGMVLGKEFGAVVMHSLLAIYITVLLKLYLKVSTRVVIEAT